MKRNAVGLALVSTLLLSVVVGTQVFMLAKANFDPSCPVLRDLSHIIIRSDGSIEPSGMPISYSKGIYRLTGDISNYSIYVERDNVVLDGAGFTLQGNRSATSDYVIVASGIFFQLRSNVTIKNFHIKEFERGIYNVGSLGVNVTNNYITGCDQGITFTFVMDVIYPYPSVVTAMINNLLGNTIEGNGNGINILGASYFNEIDDNIIANNSDTGIYFQGYSNRVKSNVIAGNKRGVLLDTVNNTIIANNITNNDVGVVLRSGIHVGNSLFYLNNFVDNGKPVSDISTRIGALWDNGLVGNYWSDYNGSDADGDGIGDSPYIIEASGQDNYPLMYPWFALEVKVLGLENSTYFGSFPLDFTVNKPVLWIVYSLDGEENVTVTGNVTLTDLSDGLHSVRVYANDTFGSMEASETISFSMAEPFPTALVVAASGASAAVIGIGLLVYFKKPKRRRAADKNE
jgi:parallel beta-helix repeat protein